MIIEGGGQNDGIKTPPLDSHKTSPDGRVKQSPDGRVKPVFGQPWPTREQGCQCRECLKAATDRGKLLHPFARNGIL